MTDQIISPEETFERLVNEAGDTRRKRSLQAINEVCRLLHERNSLDFSHKAITLLGVDRGLPVPSEKSIANPTGRHYRELIQAWRLISSPKINEKNNHSNSWIEQIQDGVLRMSVTLLAKELQAIKSKEARKIKHNGAPIVLGNAAQVVSSLPLLNEAEVAALKAAIDPSVLRLVGLLIGERGDVLDAKGRKIHGPGFRDAIEKVLAVQDL